MLGSIFRRIARVLQGKGAENDAEDLAGGDHFPVDVLTANRKRKDIRYCVTLAADDSVESDESELAAAWKCLEEQMALAPAGETVLMTPLLEGTTGDESVPQSETLRVRAVYIDRYAVTNEDYAQFVAAGAYRRPEFWPAQVLPHLLHFTDQTGTPGPRFWSDGRPPRDKLKHPVTGVCFYEAHAYAQWAGKRLPTPAEWQRAGCWSDTEGEERRYPWGNSFDPKHANTWLGGKACTVSVQDYYAGCTPNGVYQLIGNVWEWVAAVFECGCEDKHSRIVFKQPMGETRGGAFDTYFENQCTCQFRTGQPLLHRGINVGFRCCVSADQLRTASRPIVIP